MRVRVGMRELLRLLKHGTLVVLVWLVLVLLVFRVLRVLLVLLVLLGHDSLLLLLLRRLATLFLR